MIPTNVIGFDYFIKSREELLDPTCSFPTPSVDPDFDRLERLDNRSSCDLSSNREIDCTISKPLKYKKIISDVLKILAILPGVGTIIGLTRLILTLASKELSANKRKNLIIRSFFEIANLGILILPIDLAKTIHIHTQNKEKLI